MGHVVRYNTERWGKKTEEWVLYDEKRKQGRPK